MPPTPGTSSSTPGAPAAGTAAPGAKPPAAGAPPAPGAATPGTAAAPAAAPAAGAKPPEGAKLQALLRQERLQRAKERTLAEREQALTAKETATKELEALRDSDLGAYLEKTTGRKVEDLYSHLTDVFLGKQKGGKPVELPADVQRALEAAQKVPGLEKRLEDMDAEKKKAQDAFRQQRADAFYTRAWEDIAANADTMPFLAEEDGGPALFRSRFQAEVAKRQHELTDEDLPTVMQEVAATLEKELEARYTTRLQSERLRKRLGLPVVAAPPVAPTATSARPAKKTAAPKTLTNAQAAEPPAPMTAEQLSKLPKHKRKELAKEGLARMHRR